MIHDDNLLAKQTYSVYEYAVPLLLRLPFDISFKYLSRVSKKNIEIKEEFNAVETTFNDRLERGKLIDYLTLFLLTIPGIGSIIIFSSLYNWICYLEFRYVYSGTEVINQQDLESIVNRFEKQSNRYFFGKIVNRKVRKLLRNNRPIVNQNFTTINHSTSLAVNYNQQNIYFESSLKSNYIIKGFEVVTDPEKINVFAQLLHKNNFISETDVIHFIRLFENSNDKYSELKIVTWKSFNCDLMYTFLMLIHHKILPKEYAEELPPLLQKFFYNRFGRVLKDLRQSKKRMMKSIENHSSRIKPSNKKQILINKLIIEAFLPSDSTI